MRGLPVLANPFGGCRFEQCVDGRSKLRHSCRGTGRREDRKKVKGSPNQPSFGGCLGFLVFISKSKTFANSSRAHFSFAGLQQLHFRALCKACRHQHHHLRQLGRAASKCQMPAEAELSSPLGSHRRRHLVSIGSDGFAFFTPINRAFVSYAADPPKRELLCLGSTRFVCGIHRGHATLQVALLPQVISGSPRSSPLRGEKSPRPSCQAHVVLHGCGSS